MDLRNKECIEVVVTSIFPSGQDNLLFELQLPDQGILPPYEAGAHIDVYLKNGIVRQYSLCGPSFNKNCYQICVLLNNKSSGGSIAMHKEIKVGQRLSISRPRNNFALPPAEKYFFFAGGIGITPIVVLAEAAYNIGIDFELHYYVAHIDKKALSGRLNTLELEKKVFFHDGSLGDTLLSELPCCLYDIRQKGAIIACGPNGFMKHLKDTACKIGWQPEQFYSEQFSNDGLITNAEKGSFAVQVASTGETFQINHDQTIAQVLSGKGLKVDLSCEQGMCGACLTKVISGVPDHCDVVQSDEEKELNNYMTICCSRAKSDLLVLDL
jgi:ferredoxin-NADP reductase